MEPRIDCIRCCIRDSEGTKKYGTLLNKSKIIPRVKLDNPVKIIQLEKTILPSEPGSDPYVQNIVYTIIGGKQDDYYKVNFVRLK